MAAYEPTFAANPDSDEFPYPRFSLAERDRRWGLVRKMMAERGLAVIVTPANSGHSTDFQANSRYLSHCGGGPDADITVILPLEGEVTVGATTAVARWSKIQDWVSDVREARRNYGNVVINRLKELNVENARIGIAGIDRGTRTAEGTMLYQSVRRIMREFPNATLVDACDVLNRARVIKSDEEIAFLKKSNELVDSAFEAERAAARVGEVDHVVWAEATSAMLRGGSEPTLHSNWISGQRPGRTLTRASFRLLQRGDIIFNELEASWAGYRSQGVQPVCVETCDPAYVELIKLQGEIWKQLASRLKPGVTVGELSELCSKICAAEQPSTGVASDVTAELGMHGRGQGDDGPIITSTAKQPYQLRATLEANMVFIFKPGIRTNDGRYTITWGDTVVVTEQGAKRLGSREHGIMVGPS